MLTERNGKQNKMEMVILEELVPQNHLLREIDKSRMTQTVPLSLILRMRNKN